MAPVPNKSLIYKEVPTGYVEAGKHVVVEERPLDLDAADLQGGILVKVLYISCDPYLRILMRGPDVKSFGLPMPIDQPIETGIAAKVIRSDTPEYQPGDLVAAFYGQSAEYAVVARADFVPSGLRKVDTSNSLPLSYHVGYLGMAGTTAVEGLYRIGAPKKGETIFVSSAAGAVGQLVGQLAKAEGLTVIGSTGSQDKIDYVKSLGFDGAFNYKQEKPLDALQRLAPNGIDIYWDNVGGETLEAALEVANINARFIGCGSISGYSDKPEDRYGVKNLFSIVTKRILFQGFVVDLSPPNVKVAHDKLVPLLLGGELQVKEDIYKGIEEGPEVVAGVFRGKNFGKAVVKVADE